MLCFFIHQFSLLKHKLYLVGTFKEHLSYCIFAFYITVLT